MDFAQKKKLPKNELNYHIENLKYSREFSKKLIEEMGELVRSIVLFGSNTTDTLKKDSDIDIMIVLDNVSVYVTPELREAYKIITNKLTSQISDKFHIMTINLSDLWDMSRKSDPVLVNILRFGLPLFDRNLVEPLQYLLEIGKFRPTRESVNNYQARAHTLLHETQFHLKEALMDLYYAVVDQVHATLMIQNQMPPAPREMPKIFKQVFKSNSKLAGYSKVIDEIYKMAKDIEHKPLHKFTGVYYDEMRKKASDLIDNLSKFNESELKKKDIFEL